VEYAEHKTIPCGNCGTCVVRSSKHAVVADEIASPFRARRPGFGTWSVVRGADDRLLL